jgi:superfamily II DNA/RNA helicase
MQHGFEDEMRTILRLLPRKRQTMLFSATQTQDVTQVRMTTIKQSNNNETINIRHSQNTINFNTMIETINIMHNQNTFNKHQLDQRINKTAINKHQL